MQQTIQKRDVIQFIGKPIYAVKKDGTMVSGILKGLQGNRLMLQQPKEKKAQIKLLAPLVLYDLLAIGTYGGYGGYGGYGYPGYGYGYGYGFDGAYGYPGFIF